MELVSAIVFTLIILLIGFTFLAVHKEWTKLINICITVLCVIGTILLVSSFIMIWVQALS